VTWPGQSSAGMMDRARNELARRAEAQHPGWVLHHGLYGWTATRSCDGLTCRSSALPGLRPLLGIADASRSPG
jgi:hypothetical protein